MDIEVQQVDMVQRLDALEEEQQNMKTFDKRLRIVVVFVGICVLLMVFSGPSGIMYLDKQDWASHISTVFIYMCMGAATLGTGFTITLMITCKSVGQFRRHCYMRVLVAVYFCCCFSMIAIPVIAYHTLSNHRLSLTILSCYVWVWSIPYVATIGHHNNKVWKCSRTILMIFLSVSFYIILMTQLPISHHVVVVVLSSIIAAFTASFGGYLTYRFATDVLLPDAFAFQLIDTIFCLSSVSSPWLLVVAIFKPQQNVWFLVGPLVLTWVIFLVIRGVKALDHPTRVRT